MSFSTQRTGGGGGGGGGGGPVGPGTFETTELYTEAERTSDITNNAVVSFELSAAPVRGTHGRLIVRANEGTAASPEYIYYPSEDWDWSDWLDLPAKLTSATGAEDTLLSVLKRGQAENGNGSSTAALWVGRVDDTHVHLSCSHSAEFDLAKYTITQERPTGGRGPAGPSGTGVVDISGDDVDIPSEDDKGKLFLDAYKHDAQFAVRRFRATTEATGTGTEVTAVDFIQHREPTSTANLEVWFDPTIDRFSVSDSIGRWFLTSYGGALGYLGIPITGFVDGDYLGQYDTANSAANAIPTSEYDADTQYVFFNRQTQKVEYLSCVHRAGDAGCLLGYCASAD